MGPVLTVYKVMWRPICSGPACFLLMVGFGNVSSIVFIILCRRSITALFLTYFLCALSAVFFETLPNFKSNDEE